MILRSPGRAVLVGLNENTWETHRKWLIDSKRFAMELEVTRGVLKAPGWQLCLSYEQKVREAAMDLIRLQCLPLAEALDRVKDQEHRMFHWVQLFMQPGHQRAISAPLSSSKLVQLSEAIFGSSFSQPVIRGQSAIEQTRQACIHDATYGGQVLWRQRSRQVSVSARSSEEDS